MRLEEKVNEKLKVAMKSKDKISLESLRLIKSEILLLKTKSVRSVVNTLAKETKLPKNHIYNEVLKVKDGI